MADTYKNFEELRQVNTYESDYNLLMGFGTSGILFMTPHGGGIESGASELCMFSAGTKHSYYALEGWRSSGNTALHITSTHWDEPNGTRMVKESNYTVSYHGYASSTKNTKIGGRDLKLMQLVKANFEAAGIPCELEPTTSNIAGAEPTNIVNKNKRRMGIQLEISTAQRTAFFDTNTRSDRRNTTNAEFDAYVNAVVSAVESYVQ
ncbi:poly-gamma-glutamate hydrolase family protein [Priestia aryabhattai]|uniref:poly-gamma-glutamate hydrolase family protein n=1 Tax=Priestia aryabhattai TaxID=412384 RepID=UPI002882C6A6|nr:poly-gamma-glutamate hydrolase family protein [Priestia aryabhattai]MDT0149979.1 poly-gamma-glutamate hydrolase family protein [Priestia aryabhattai]MDT0155637.1 poly-gamma-glutamate hydrolase family protein [Priestia aryabhattai]